MPVNKPTVSRLSDLRRAQPADATLRNLVDVLAAKLELFGHLPVFEYEADIEGHTSGAAAFRDLAQHERQSFDELLVALRRHLDEITLPNHNGSAASALSEGRA